MKLTPDSSLKEVFDFIYNHEVDVQVMPVTLSKNTDTTARMMILIQGKHNTASVIMANLMASIQEMHDLATQKEAEQAIIAPDGEPLSDEPQIILP